MQVTPLDKEQVRAEIRAAFATVEAPTAVPDMLYERYRSSEDAWEMAAAFAGRRWADLAVRELFYHREMLNTLSPPAYRAYLPAYLDAAVASDEAADKYGPDIREYLLSTLKVWPHQSAYVATATPERVAALDDHQRDAVEQVLRYLVARWDSKDAAEVLAAWLDAA